MPNKIVASRGNPKSWFTVDTDQGPAEVGVMQFPDLSFSFYCDLDKVLPPPKSSEPRHMAGRSISRVTVTMKTTIPEAVIGLAQLFVALQDQKSGGPAWMRNFELELKIQTAPDQRADKKTVPGEGTPAYVTSAFIGNMGFDSITIYDVHSDVFAKGLRLHSQRPVVHHSALWCFTKAMEKHTTKVLPTDFVVAVDEGAIHRAEEFAKAYLATPELTSLMHVIYCDKNRDEMGKITGHVITKTSAPSHAETSQANFWIIDDMCDGGATFISVAKLLRESFRFNKLNLYVTHGLFSKGKNELLKVYDNVFALFDYSEE